MTQSPLTSAAAWQALSAHAETMSATTIRELFDASADVDRAAVFSADGAGWHLDFAKQRITGETIDLLVALAEERDLAGRREAMFTGVHINNTEDRAVLHTALRLPAGATLVVDGQDVVADVHDGAGQDGGVRRPGPRRDVAGLHRPADPQRGEHRHRRLGPRAR